MRLHISIDDDVARRLDQRVGPRDRSSFIERAIRLALDDAVRRDALESALGSIGDSGHDWDEDPAQWVRNQRADRRAAG
jgi:predicted transcriptional regulator